MMMKQTLMIVAMAGVLATAGAPANAADYVRIATLPGTGWMAGDGYRSCGYGVDHCWL